jgi:hypothetical protein
MLSNLKKVFPFSMVALAGIFMLATGFERYQDHPLKPVTDEILPTFALDTIQVQVAAKAMTAEESKRNFGHDLISRGVIPLQLTIQNNTSDEYSLCASSVDLDRVEASKIAFKVTKSSIPRGIAYKIASLFFWPIMIPGTIDSIRVFTHHKNLKKDFIAKSLREEKIAPYSSLHRVLFVPDDKYKETFKVTLIELDSLKATEFQTTVVGAVKPVDDETMNS